MYRYLPALVLLLSACADEPYVGDARTFLGTHDGNFGGIAGADDACASDSANPDKRSTWRAMIVGDDRVACASANCEEGTTGQVDWVFQPSTPYLNPAGQALFTTDANGIFTDYPMSADLTDSGINFWTGLDKDWTAFEDFSCADWSTTDGEGRVGWTAIADDSWVQGGALSCADELPFLCVEQQEEE